MRLELEQREADIERVLQRHDRQLGGRGADQQRT
jgi:hypothetical protein